MIPITNLYPELIYIQFSESVAIGISSVLWELQIGQSRTCDDDPDKDSSLIPK